jgi:predicted DNA-binding protein
MRTKRNKMLSVRASDEEIERVKMLATELIRTHRYLKEADVIRELIGLEDTGLITPEMRRRLLSQPPPANIAAPATPFTSPDPNTPIPTQPLPPMDPYQSYESTPYVPSQKKGNKK